MYDLVIKNGTIIDGTGSPGYVADVAVSGGKIVRISKGIDGERVIDAKGLIVSPGFIDSHSHADDAMFDIDRFYNSAARVGIEIPYTKAELKSLLEELVLKVDTQNTDGETFLYWQITRGSDTPRNHVFPENSKAKLWVTVTPRRLADVYRRAKLISREDIRHYMCDIKTLCLLPNVLVSEQAFSLEFLMDADEIILSSSSNFCIAATHVDDIPVGGKATALLRKIQDALLEDYLTHTQI